MSDDDYATRSCAVASWEERVKRLPPANASVCSVVTQDVSLIETEGESAMDYTKRLIERVLFSIVEN
eukprot:3924568-Amphidinium_carterae.1